MTINKEGFSPNAETKKGPNYDEKKIESSGKYNIELAENEAFYVDDFVCMLLGSR